MPGVPQAGAGAESIAGNLKKDEQRDNFLIKGID